MKTKRITKSPSTRYRLTRNILAGLLAAALGWCCTMRAQTIVNGDFETGAGDFVILPGYLNQGSNPSAIPGWIGGSGINPIASGEAPFMDNGHNSTHAAFLQGWASLQQAIPGLVPDAEYVLSLDYNARACCGDLPIASVSVNASEVWNSRGPISPVGGNNPWHHVEIPFKAPPGVLTSDTLFIEAEDFDFDHGKYVTDQPIGMNGPYPGGSYLDKGTEADASIDWNAPGVNYADQPYRPRTGVAAGKPNQHLDGLLRGAFDVEANYVVGWNDAGDWYNYTREFPKPAQEYKVYARLSSGGDPINGELAVITSGRGPPNQVKRFPGIAAPGRGTGCWGDF